MQKYNKTFLGYLEMESSIGGNGEQKAFQHVVSRLTSIELAITMIF